MDPIHQRSLCGSCNIEPVHSLWSLSSLTTSLLHRYQPINLRLSFSYRILFLRLLGPRMSPVFNFLGVNTVVFVSYYVCQNSCTLFSYMYDVLLWCPNFFIFLLRSLCLMQMKWWGRMNGFNLGTIVVGLQRLQIVTVLTVRSVYEQWELHSCGKNPIVGSI